MRGQALSQQMTRRFHQQSLDSKAMARSLGGYTVRSRGFDYTYSLDPAANTGKAGRVKKNSLAAATANAVGLRALERLQIRAALMAFRKAVKLDRQSVVAISGVGMCLYGQDKWENSARAMAKAVTIMDAKYAALHARLDVAKAFNESSASIKAYREAVLRVNTTRGHVYNLLGRGLFESRNWPASIAALEKSVEVVDDAPEAWEWLARAYDRAQKPYLFFYAWQEGLRVDPLASDRNVWPVFCITIRDKSAKDTPLLSLNVEKRFVNNLEKEDPQKPSCDSFLDKYGPFEGEKYEHSPVTLSSWAQKTSPSKGRSRFSTLRKLLKKMRRLECTPQFVGDRNSAMHNYYEQISKVHPERDYSYINFAYGMVFYHGWWRLWRYRTAAAMAIETASTNNMKWVSLGSNIGTETFYAALTYGIQGRGYDVLCSLVDIANTLKKDLGVEDLVDFYCKDALDSDLSDAGIVWIDNQSWDDELVNAIYQKMGRELPPDSIVIDFNSADWGTQDKTSPGELFDVAGCASLDVSWDNKAGTTVTLLKKRWAKMSGSYFDFSVYGESLRNSWQSVMQMLKQVPDAVSAPIALPSRLGDIADLDIRFSASPQIMTTVMWSNVVMEIYQRVLFNWHCLTFSDLHKPLLPSEVNYIETFFKIHGEEHRSFDLRGDWVGNRMSSYTYSHQIRDDKQEKGNMQRDDGSLERARSSTNLDDGVEEDNLLSTSVGKGYSERLSSGVKVDSSRFRFGTTSQFGILYNAAIPVFKARNIDKEIVDGFILADGGESFSFYGLGWDHKKKFFKIYLMVHEYAAITRKCTKNKMSSIKTESGKMACLLQDLVTPNQASIALQHNLISFTFRYNGKKTEVSAEVSATGSIKEEVKANVSPTLHEYKVYLYPRDIEQAATIGIPVPSYTGTAALMFSSNRGIIPQFDIDKERVCMWRAQLTPTGKRILDVYFDVGISLETVAFSDEKLYNLYFPAGSG
jgi:tetratricopeptide (TPR) repeat protein